MLIIIINILLNYYKININYEVKEFYLLIEVKESVSLNSNFFIKLINCSSQRL